MNLWRVVAGVRIGRLWERSFHRGPQLTFIPVDTSRIPEEEKQPGVQADRRPVY